MTCTTSSHGTQQNLTTWLGHPERSQAAPVTRQGEPRAALWNRPATLTLQLSLGRTKQECAEGTQWWLDCWVLIEPCRVSSFLPLPPGAGGLAREDDRARLAVTLAYYETVWETPSTGCLPCFTNTPHPEKIIVKIPSKPITLGSGTIWSQTHGINHSKGHDAEDWEQTNKNEGATRAGEKRWDHTRQGRLNQPPWTCFSPKNGSNECQATNLGIKRQVHKSKAGNLWWKPGGKGEVGWLKSIWLYATFSVRSPAVWMEVPLLVIK